MKKTKEEILEKHLSKYFLDDQTEDGGAWLKAEILGAMQEYADLKIKEELEDLVESMKETHCEYHLAITEGELNDYKNKCK